MARNGFKIFDSDTHVGPAANILERYLTESEKQKLKVYEPYRSTHQRTGHVTYTRGIREYRRRLGSLEAETKGPRPSRTRIGEPSLRVDDDPAERIKDMDSEGVDVNLTLPSAWFGTFTMSEDVELETAMYHAYHRWIADYCGAFPTRIKGIILVCFRDVAASLKELERCAKQDWPLAAFVYAPSGVPLDHPNLEPVWAACQDYDLSVARSAHIYCHAAVCAGRTRHMGKPVAAALRRAPVVRHAQYGGVTRDRRNGPLPTVENRRPRGRAWLVTVLDGQNR